MPLHPSTAPLFLDHVISTTTFSKRRRPTSAPMKRKERTADPAAGTESVVRRKELSDSEANDVIRNKLRKLKLKLIGELQLMNEAVCLAGKNMGRGEYRKHVFETADYIMKEFISITAVDKTDLSAFVHNLWALVVSLQPHEAVDDDGEDARGEGCGRIGSNKASEVYYQPRDSYHRLKVPFYPAACQTDPVLTRYASCSSSPLNNNKDSLPVLEQTLQLMVQTLESQTKSITFLVDAQKKVASRSNRRTGKMGILPDVCKLEAAVVTSSSLGTSQTVARLMDDSSDEEDTLVSPSNSSKGDEGGRGLKEKDKEDEYVTSGYKVYTNAANLASHIKHTVGNLENYIQVLEEESVEFKAKCERLETQLHFYRKQLELTSSDMYSLRVEMASETSRRVKAETELSSLAVISEMKIVPKSSVDTQTDDVLQPTATVSSSFASMAGGNLVTSNLFQPEPPSRLPLNQVGLENNGNTARRSATITTISTSAGKKQHTAKSAATYNINSVDKPKQQHVAKASTAISLRKSTLPAPIPVTTPRDDPNPALTLQHSDTGNGNASAPSRIGTHGGGGRSTPNVVSMENSVVSVSKPAALHSKRGKGKSLVQTSDAEVQVEFDNDFVRNRNNQSIEHFFLKASKTSRFNFLDSGDIERSFFSERGKIIGRHHYDGADDGAASETESERIAQLIWKRR